MGLDAGLIPTCEAYTSKHPTIAQRRLALRKTCLKMSRFQSTRERRPSEPMSASGSLREAGGYGDALRLDIMAARETSKALSIAGMMVLCLV